MPIPDQQRPTVRWVWLLPGLLILGILWTVIGHYHSRARLAATTRALQLENVSVIHAQLGNPTTEVSLPATIQAYSQSLVYARTNGYLRDWYVDIGSSVKQGQLLATIDAPEVDQELMRARAVLRQTQAALALAKVTAGRYLELIKINAVSQQETDQATQNLAAQKANLQAATADGNRLQQMQGFEKIVAPYDGVITERKTQVGQLVNAGNVGPKQELYRISQVGTLRVFVNVPESYSRQVITGSTATVVVTELPNARFTGTVVRTNNAIDPNSRTLLTEVDVQNSSGTLLPGAYAEVRFQLPVQSGAIVLPTSSVLFQAAGPQVGVVNNQNQVELRKVVLGRDFGTTVEVLSGVSPNDQVIATPPDYLVNGMKVSVQASTATKAGT